jgi:hypothetical protein
MSRSGRYQGGILRSRSLSAQRRRSPRERCRADRPSLSRPYTPMPLESQCMLSPFSAHRCKYYHMFSPNTRCSGSNSQPGHCAALPVRPQLESVHLSPEARTTGVRHCRACALTDTSCSSSRDTRASKDHTQCHLDCSVNTALQFGPSRSLVSSMYCHEPPTMRECCTSLSCTCPRRGSLSSNQCQRRAGHSCPPWSKRTAADNSSRG